MRQFEICSHVWISQGRDRDPRNKILYSINTKISCDSVGAADCLWYPIAIQICKLLNPCYLCAVVCRSCGAASISSQSSDRDSAPNGANSCIAPAGILTQNLAVATDQPAADVPARLLRSLGTLYDTIFLIAMSSVTESSGVLAASLSDAGWYPSEAVDGWRLLWDNRTKRRLGRLRIS